MCTLAARPELPAGETWECYRLAGRYLDRHSLPEAPLSTLFRKKPSPPIQVNETVRQHKCLVILGDPGSGKTTMLKYMALNLARKPDSPLPIFIPLNAYARALTRQEDSFYSFLSEYYAGHAVGVAALGPFFEDAIRQGQAVILLDGLDEVQSGRAALVNKVEVFSEEAVRRGNKVIVTSRIVGYRDAPLVSKE